MHLSSFYNSFCDTQNVTYEHRVYNPETLNWCPVPGGGADALLFAGLAVFCSCALYSKLSAVWVLLAGALFQLLNFTYNLNHFSNALTIWLGMHPSTIFFQIFLPPLLLDSAVRVDFFLFKKMAAHCLLFAFVNVLVSTLAFIPLMLYGLNLASAGWRPIDAALFGAVLGSTDAVAVTAILKAGGAPEMLSVLLEGESLFNDATSIVLFEIFLHLGMGSSGDEASLRRSMWHILKLICWLFASGSLAGLLMGLLTSLLLKLLHRKHVPPPVEVAVSLAGAYTVYLCTEYYIRGSGVIAVVVYGLYGASSFLWGFSSKGMRQQSFFKFWDVVSFVTNGMVFFFVGASVMNFLLSLTGELFKDGYAAALLLTGKCLPAILVAMFGLRWLLMTLEAPLLSLVGPALNWKEVLFSALGGLRGGLALILAQTVLATHGTAQDPTLKVVHAQMVIWVALVVLFTLTVNAPALGPLMSVLGLNKTTPAQRHMHRRAHAALAQYTSRTIADLQADDDEMLRGVDWSAVISHADMGMAVKRVLHTGDSTVNRQASKPCASQTNGGTAHQLSSLLHDENDVEGSGFSRGQSPDGPMVLTRSSLARSSKSFRGLTVPLLGRQYSARERYTTGDDESVTSDNAPQGDLEAGDLQQAVPQVVAESNSEAVFIASRLQEQDAQLAQHAEDTVDGPLLARAHDSDSDSDNSTRNARDRTAYRNGSGGYSDSTSVLDNADHSGESEGVAMEEGDEWYSNSTDNLQAAATTAAVVAGPGERDADQSEARGAAGGKAKPKFRQLNPLIAVRMTDAMNTVNTSTHYNMTGVYGHVHSAVLHANNTPAPVSAAATAGSAGCSSFAAAAPDLPAAFPRVLPGNSMLLSDRPRSFISAACAATAAASSRRHSTGGSSTGSGSRTVSHRPVRLNEGLSAGSSGPLRGAGRNSVQIMRSVWNQHVHQVGQQVPGPGPSRLRLGTGQHNGTTAAAPTAGAAVRAVPVGIHGRDAAALRAPVGELRTGAGVAGEAVLVDAGRLLQDLDTMSDLSTDDEDDMTQEEFLEECRVSLLAGLKRHFRFKATEGLLSNTSLRQLEYACDTALDHADKPLDLWKTIGTDIKRRGWTSVTATVHLQLRKYQTALLRSSRGGGGWLLWLLQKPLSKTSLMLRNRLGVAALTVLEVALELWLALTASPQARMTRSGTSLASAMLAEELKQQADAVWRFIMDRQIEAPDEFATLQTHRAQLAVARRQLTFVEQLAEVGAVEEAAAEALQEMVERRLNRLERRGPTWSTPSLTDVLRRQPFLAEQSESMLLWLRAYGELKTYSPGQCIVPRRRPGPPGIYIVLSGLVRVEAVRCGQQLTHFVGVGSTVGFINSLLGKDVPGVVLVSAFAQGNALGKGPLVLHLPMRLLATIKQRAAAALPSSQQQQQQQHLDAMTFSAGTFVTGVTRRGVTSYTLDPVASDTAASSLNAAAFAQLLLDMHRQTGVMLLDRMADAAIQQVAGHIEAAVQAIFDYVSLLPSPKAQAKLQRLLEATLGSSSSSSAIGASAGLGDEHVSVGGSAAAEVGSSSSAAYQQAAIAEAAMQLVVERANAAVALLRALLHSADLITLAPGQQLAQSSSMLLLLGCLRVNNSSTYHIVPAAASHAPGEAAPSDAQSAVNTAGTSTAAAVAAAGGSGSLALRQFNAPTLLAWGPEIFEQLEDRYKSSTPLYTAGPRGALLLVTPSEGSSSSGGSEGEDVADTDTLAMLQQQGIAAAEAAGEGVAAEQQSLLACSQRQWRRRQQECERLSSVMPLHKTAAYAVGPDQDG